MFDLWTQGASSQFDYGLMELPDAVSIRVLD